jgi:HprK-related kinase A
MDAHLAASVTYALRSGPFNIRLEAGDPAFRQLFESLYNNATAVSVGDVGPIYHYAIRLNVPSFLRRYFRPQIELTVDGLRPFEPYPRKHAFPLFEWGLNWILAMTAHQYLMLHSAVLERNGIACIFPALPGSGKSTLCAALAHHGWRLLSDEFGLVDYQTMQILPMPRPIGLKNQSIEIIREYLPQAFIGPNFYNTRKGTVAHVAPPSDSIAQQHVAARPALIVFPRYSPEHGCRLKSISKSLAFTRLSNNAFNYKVSMANGFRALGHLIQTCDAYSLEYHSFEQAINSLNELCDERSH